MNKVSLPLLSSMILSALMPTGSAFADPVPGPRARPTPTATPKCRIIKPNGPDLTGTLIPMPAGCGDLNVQLRLARLGAGVSLDGKALIKDISVRDGGLGNATVSGDKLAGAMLLGETEDGDVVRLRIDSVAAADDPNPKTPANENADVWLYKVSVQRSATGKATSPQNAQFKAASATWSPLCKDGGAAIVVGGSWNMHMGDPNDGAKEPMTPATQGNITFACVGSAIAKCVTTMGYKPWRSTTPTVPNAKAVSLDALHQACVRAVRADYCGNGLSMTVAGTVVNFYDSLGVQKDEAPWPLEAVWTPAGATCVNVPRLVTAPADPVSARPAMKVRDYLAMRCPNVTKLAPCDKAGAPDGVMLLTEASPNSPASPAATTPPPPSKPATRN